MPIHVVPLVVGGTIAVIGTGYAFKKFVYDPHLAPLVEALLATRSSSKTTHESHRLTEPISAKTSSSATSTARVGDRGLLRRRHHGQVYDEEEREGLLAGSGGPSPGPGLEDGSRRGSTNTITQEARRPRPLIGRSSSDRPRPQDDEIRSIIFNVDTSVPPSPPAHRRQSGTGGLILTSAGSTVLVPMPMPGPGSGPDAYSPPRRIGPDPSTTFSFLSLSQASSPEVPTANLDSMSMSFSQFQNPRDHPHQHQHHHLSPGSGSGSGRRDEEVISLPDDTSGGYQTEDFSALSSPRQQPSTTGLGLNNVGDVGMSYLSPGRTSRSVISLSESDGVSAGASDWEALSEPRSAAK